MPNFIRAIALNYKPRTATACDEKLVYEPIKILES